MNPHDSPDTELPDLRQLPMSRAPQHDLWPAIEAQLAPRRRRGFMPMAMAASLLLSIGVITGLMLSNGTPIPGAGELPTTTHAFLEPGDDRRIALPKDRIDTAMIKANLQIAQIAERQLLDALAQDPDARSLQNLLTSTRQQQATLQAML